MDSVARFAFIFSLLFSSLHAFGQQVTNDAYARDMMGQVEKNPFGLCWRTYSWTPEKAIRECDPDLFPEPTAKPAAAPAPAPVVAAPPAPVPAPVPAPAAAPVVAAPAAAPAPAAQRRTVSLTLGADATFDTGKAELKPEGRVKLDDVAAKLSEPGVQIDSMTITGHTDSVGSAASNQRLSERRAEAVKSYLVGKGIDGAKIRTVGRGLTQPVADNKTAPGRARNRRVDVEITGARAAQ
jgi:OmpA-OmpF porin, OOP family